MLGFWPFPWASLVSWSLTFLWKTDSTGASESEDLALPGSGGDPLNLSRRQLSSGASPLSSGAGYSHWFTFCPLRRETEAREGQGHPQGPGHLQTPLPAFCLLQLHPSPPPPQRVLASHISQCQGKLFLLGAASGLDPASSAPKTRLEPLWGRHSRLVHGPRAIPHPKAIGRDLDIF